MIARQARRHDTQRTTEMIVIDVYFFHLEIVIKYYILLLSRVTWKK